MTDFDGINKIMWTYPLLGAIRQPLYNGSLLTYNVYKLAIWFVYGKSIII